MTDERARRIEEKLDRIIEWFHIDRPGQKMNTIMDIQLQARRDHERCLERDRKKAEAG